MISRTKIRSVIASIFAIIVLLVFLAFFSSYMGWNLPIISNIANMLGFNG